MNIKYFIKSALNNMRRSLLVNIVTISTICIAILIFSTFLMIIYNLTNIVNKFKDEVHIVSYLKDEYASSHKNILNNIMKLKGVSAVKFTSKDEAYDDFKKSLSNDERLLDSVYDNPLPASFEIRLVKGRQNKEALLSIVSALNSMGIFDDISFGEEWIANFQKFLNILNIIGAAIGGGFLFAAMFIISNTIKLTVYARREEIEILKLVGATDSFIKAPFFIEGIIQGFLGALVSIFALYLIYLSFLVKVKTLSFISINSHIMPFLPAEILLLIVIFSMILGAVGSFVSLGRL